MLVISFAGKRFAGKSLTSKSTSNYSWYRLDCIGWLWTIKNPLTVASCGFLGLSHTALDRNLVVESPPETNRVCSAIAGGCRLLQALAGDGI